MSIFAHKRERLVMKAVENLTGHTAQILSRKYRTVFAQSEAIPSLREYTNIKLERCLKNETPYAVKM